MSEFVVFDTNIIVSAIHSPMGNPAKALELMYNDEVTAVYSFDLLEEYEDVLYRPVLGLNADDVKKVLETFITDGKLVAPATSTVCLPDEDDRPFYDAAQTAGTVLITGNLKHYPKELWIMNPTDYLNSKATST